MIFSSNTAETLGKPGWHTIYFGIVYCIKSSQCMTFRQAVTKELTVSICNTCMTLSNFFTRADEIFDSVKSLVRGVPHPMQTLCQEKSFLGCALPVVKKNLKNRKIKNLKNKNCAGAKIKICATANWVKY